jgi:hypothetical protein
MTMPRPSILIGSAGLAVLAAAPAASRAEEAPRQRAAALEFFEKEVRPLLAANCYTCHSANTNAKGGLRTDDRNGLLQGGDGGPAVVPGKPEESLLLQAVRHEDGAPKMPPKKRLTQREIAVLERWIKDGAAWPEAKGASPPGRTNARYEALRKEHWAWQPLKTAAPPKVRHASSRSTLHTGLGLTILLERLDPFGRWGKARQVEGDPADQAEAVGVTRRRAGGATGST